MVKSITISISAIALILPHPKNFCSSCALLRANLGDQSITGWQLMFLRSAKNAGFDVPQQVIDDAVGYVKRCFSDRFQTFQLFTADFDKRSRGMAGAGILALAHAGAHDVPEVKAAGKFILDHPFNQYNVIEPFTQTGWINDRYHYGAFMCAQAMYQLGGDYWEKFYPPTVKVLLDNQHADGSWPAESHFFDSKFGNAYATALSVLTLSASNQLLPIFQR